MRSEINSTFIELARREQILRAAIELLAEGGYAAASLAAIAARIGSSKGVISYHFDGKDELLAQVVQTVLADAATSMAIQIDAADGAAAKLRAYVTSNLYFLSTNRREIRALTAVLTGLPPRPDGSPAYAAAGQAAVEALTGLFEAGQRDGEFRPFRAAIAARSLRASIDAVSDLLYLEPDLDVTGYADELLILFETAVLA